MTLNVLSRSLRLRVSLWLTSMGLITIHPHPSATAQVIPDRTLGTQSAIVNTTGTLDTINGGARVGNHLFHSFQELNVAAGRSLYFNDPGVNTILARVTGSHPSIIHGRLGVNGNAQLFLLNPNGIMFGRNASLDIRGSFTATTKAIQFADGSQFSATQPTHPSLLSISAPIGLQRTRTQSPATIVTQGPLRVGQQLTLAADRIAVQGSLSARQDLNLLATETVQVSGSPAQPTVVAAGHNLQIQGDRLFISNGGQLRTEPGPTGQLGSIAIGTANHPFQQIILSGRNTVIATSTRPGSSNNGGNIRLYSQDLSLHQPARITANTAGRGNAGNITLRLTGALNLDGMILGGVGPGAQGNGGLIDVIARSVTVTDPGHIQSETLGPGRAGDVHVQAAAMTVTGRFSGIIAGSGSRRQPINAGPGGNIRLTTGALRLLKGGLVAATSFTASRSGHLDVQARTIELINGGQLAAVAEGGGSAGNITVAARDRVTIIHPPSGIFASTGSQSSGNGGSIDLTTRYLDMQDRARITVDSRGRGNGGELHIAADRIDLTDQSRLFAATVGSQGGNIQLDVRDLLLLRRAGLISASAGTAQAGGDGGNIAIQAGFVVGVLRDNSDITANAFTGNGGQVNITAQSIWGLAFQPNLTPFSDITASSQFGTSGTVTLNTLNIDPSRGLVQLPSDLTDATQKISQTCSVQQRQSSFVVTGRGGLTPDPSEALNQTIVWTDEAATMPRTSAPTTRVEPSTTTIVEATGWMRNPDGSISLVAATQPSPPPLPSQTCQLYPASDRP